jgi:hypothetical protein
MTLHVVSNSPSFAPVAPQFFPHDAHAVIYRPARSAMTSGKARTHDWKLRFERRTPPFIEPLMGWTSGDDTLTQVELSFPTVESAIAYAQRQGLTYTVQGMPQRAPRLSVVTRTTDAERANAIARRERLEWVERRLGPEIMRHGFGPGPDVAKRYAVPKDVLNDAALTADQKRDLLQRWALDAYQLDLAFSRLSEPYASLLQEVIDALVALDRAAHARPHGDGGKGTEPAGTNGPRRARG